MFLNFMMEGKCQRLAGVDLMHYIEQGEGAGGGARHFALWGRCLVGAIFSPYQTGKWMGQAKEIILGDLSEIVNVYHWSMVRLNLPGSDLYDPRMAWVVKVRPDGRVAIYIFIYMDDFRLTGPDEEAC
jgi:hypothetical protein